MIRFSPSDQRIAATGDRVIVHHTINKNGKTALCQAVPAIMEEIEIVVVVGPGHEIDIGDLPGEWPGRRGPS